MVLYIYGAPLLVQWYLEGVPVFGGFCSGNRLTNRHRHRQHHVSLLLLLLLYFLFFHAGHSYFSCCFLLLHTFSFAVAVSTGCVYHLR